MPTTRSLISQAASLLVVLLSACGGDDDVEPATLAPSAPSNLRAEVLDPRRIALSWSAAPNNAGVTGYRVFRGGTQIASVSAGLVYLDTGLQVGSSYTYGIQACDAAANCSATAQVTATTPGATELSLAASRFLMDDTRIVGSDAVSRNGVAYAGAPIVFGPYIVSGLGTPQTISLGGLLAANSTLIVDGAPAASSASVVDGSVLTLRVDFAAFAAALTASSGLPVPYARHYPSTLMFGGKFISFGGPGAGGAPLGGIITCSDPRSAVLSYTTRCN